MARSVDAARSGVIFTALMLTTALALNIGFAIWAHYQGHVYPPLHIFKRASNGASPIFPAAVLILLLSSLVWVALKISERVDSWLVCTWLVMSVLFIPEGIKEFAPNHFNLAWEGGQYMTFPLPLLVAAIALRAWPSLDRRATLEAGR